MKDFLALMNPTRWSILAGVLLALLVTAAGATWTVHSHGLDTGRAEVKAQWLGAENAALREHQREISRLAGLVNTLNEAYREQLQKIDALADDLRARGLRQSKAERDSAIAAGTAQAVRDYAAAAADSFAACRGEYVELGRGYASCAAAAQSLDQYANAVSRRPTPPSAPTPPSPPAQP